MEGVWGSRDTLGGTRSLHAHTAHTPDLPTSSGAQGLPLHGQPPGALLPPHCHRMPRCDPHARRTCALAHTVRHTAVLSRRGPEGRSRRPGWEGSETTLGHPSPTMTGAPAWVLPWLGVQRDTRPQQAGKEFQERLAEQPSIPSRRRAGPRPAARPQFPHLHSRKARCLPAGAGLRLGDRSPFEGDVGHMDQ